MALDFQKWRKEANTDAWKPTLLQYDSWRGHMDHNNEIRVAGWAIRWSGWMTQYAQDTLTSYWAANNADNLADILTRVSPCFGIVQEIRDYEIIDFSSGGLTYLMARINPIRLRELADYEKRASLFRLLTHLGIPEEIENAIGLQNQKQMIQQMHDSDEPATGVEAYADSGEPPVDGEISCSSCHTPLNRTDKNCWRCGHVLQ